MSAGVQVEWTGGAIGYGLLDAYPNVSQVGGIDANLNTYSAPGGGPLECHDKNGLLLWSITGSDLQTIFVNAGAASPTDSAQMLGAFVSPDGTRVILVGQWVIAGDPLAAFRLYIGVAPINATGSVANPVLTNYMRLTQPGGGDIFPPFQLHQMTDASGAETGLVLELTHQDLFFYPIFVFLPTVAQLEAGTFKGSHPGCSGTLTADQGPWFALQWTNSTAENAALMGNAGTLQNNPIGFLVNVDGGNRFYFVVPRAWMADTSNGFHGNYSTFYPDGAAFYLDWSTYAPYADQTWGGTSTVNNVSITTDPIDVTADGFQNANGTEAIPWPDEWTRIYDEGPNNGWLTSYVGAAIVLNPGATPTLLFTIIDGNNSYPALIGGGQRVFYARVRSYVWNSGVGAFVQASQSQGIVLRQGDLGRSDFNFDHCYRQVMAAYDDKLYFQLITPHGVGNGTLLTQFGVLGPLTARRRQNVSLLKRTVYSWPVVVPSTLEISGTPPASGVVGIPYDFDPDITGGTAPFTFSISAGALPDGVTLNIHTGEISGVPVSPGTSSGIVLRVTDSTSAHADLGPFSIAVTASGTAVTPSTWFGILEAASPGDVLLMQPGDYGAMNIPVVNFAAPGVSMVGQAGVTCTDISVRNSSGLTFQAITVTGHGSNGYATTAQDCTRVTFDSNIIDSGVPSANGMQVRGHTSSSQVTLSNNIIRLKAEGISLVDGDQITVRNNHITGMGNDGMLIAGGTNIEILSNYIADPQASFSGHADAIQFAASGDTGLKPTGVTVRYNNFDRGTAGGGPMQGFFFEDTVDAVVENNAAFGTLVNGVSLGRCSNFVVNNTFVQGWDYGSVFIVRGASSVVTFSNSFAFNFENYAGDGPNTGVTFVGNTILAPATGPTDRTAYEAFLAANPLIPTS